MESEDKKQGQSENEKSISDLEPPQETMVPSEDEKEGRSEYERYMAELAPLLEKIKVTNLTKKDVEFLTNKTEVDFENIKLLLLANHYATLTQLSPEFFYGLLRTQIPSDPLALLTLTSDILRLGLRNAIRDNIVSDFLAVSMDEDIETAKTAWIEKPDDEEEVTNQLKSMQRIYNVVPRFDSMRTLMAAGLYSAQDISKLPEDMFSKDIDDVPPKDSSQDEKDWDKGE